ncbi:MAG: CPBP family intramembrane metalloprotease [Clostridia bacterium]|nr:CPBP family intramembrane metalloprotease [Clostridia bacterium]
MQEQSKPKRKISKILFAILAFVFALWSIFILITQEVLASAETPPEEYIMDLLSLAAELLLALAVIILFFLIESRQYLKVRFGRAAGIVAIIAGLIPCLANFPFLTLFSGELEFNDLSGLPYLIGFCLVISLFEEFACRGLFLLEIAKRIRHTKLGVLLSILLSGALFSLLHLLNLSAGAPLTDTLYQMGLAFVMGCMFAFIMLLTGSIIWPVLLHTIYNIGGMIEGTEIITGQAWNNEATIILLSCILVAIIVDTIIFIKKKTPFCLYF